MKRNSHPGACSFVRTLHLARRHVLLHYRPCLPLHVVRSSMGFFSGSGGVETVRRRVSHPRGISPSKWPVRRSSGEGMPRIEGHARHGALWSEKFRSLRVRPGSRTSVQRLIIMVRQRRVTHATCLGRLTHDVQLVLGTPTATHSESLASTRQGQSILCIHVCLSYY